MGVKLKNLFRQVCSNKKALLFSLGLILFLTLAPLRFAQAIGLIDVFGAITNISTILSPLGWTVLILTALFSAGAMIGSIFFAMLSEIMKKFIEATLSLSVMPGGNNPAVTIGWEFSRNLVNILFILILVFIGLATILRLQTYQAQKTLPALIIIALLVNFSGVFVGFVADIANLFTKVFVEKIGGWGTIPSTSLQIAKSLLTGFASLAKDWSGPGTIFVPLIKAALLFIVYLALSIALIAVALTFIIRAGALWILMILAPLAFASYILPATKKFWSQWLQQLIQWSILGIPISLFLYLAELTAENFSSWGQIYKCPDGNFLTCMAGSGGGSYPALVDIFGSLMGPVVALLFIVAGMGISMQMAPAGAKAIMHWGGKRGLKWLGKRRQVQLALGGVAGSAAKLFGNEKGPFGRLSKKIEETKSPFLAPIRWANRQPRTLAIPRLTEYAAKQRRTPLPTGWEQMDNVEKERNVSNTGVRGDRLFKASKMKAEGNFQKTSESFQRDIVEDTKAYLRKNGSVDPQHKKEIEDIYDARPDLLTEDMKIGLRSSEVSGGSVRNSITEIADEYGIRDRDTAAGILHARGFKPKDVPGLSKTALKSEPVQLAMRSWGSSHMQALKEFDEGTVRSALNEGRGLNNVKESEYDKIKSKNPSLTSWNENVPAGKEMLNNWTDRFVKPRLEAEEKAKERTRKAEEDKKEADRETKAKKEQEEAEKKKKAEKDKEKDDELAKKITARAELYNRIEEKRKEVAELRAIPLPRTPPRTMPAERKERISQLEKEIEELERKRRLI